MSEINRHCDEYIDDLSQPLCLRRFLCFQRWPALWRMRARRLEIKVPTLFATTHAECETILNHIRSFGIRNNTRVQVVLASRLGDVTIKQDDKHVRVYLSSLTDFSEN